MDFSLHPDSKALKRSTDIEERFISLFVLIIVTPCSTSKFWPWDRIQLFSCLLFRQNTAISWQHGHYSNIITVFATLLASISRKTLEISQ
tara:strand:+ start:169 stop:438 length:270 start_codon:yes stop_codon:yes gene_type:complete